MKKIIKVLIIMVGVLAFNINVNAEEIVSETTRYFKTTTIYDTAATTSSMSTTSRSSITTEITEDEYNKISTNEENDMLALVETTYKKLKTSISTTGSQYKYQVSLTWKKIPKVRSYDIIGIGFLSSVALDGSITFNQKSCYKESCTNSSSCTTASSSTGVTAVFKVPSSTIDKLVQTMSFKVKKNTTSTISSQVAAGDYSHATSTITKANAQKHTIGETGITLNSSITSKYDTIKTAKATWAGSW